MNLSYSFQLFKKQNLVKQNISCNNRLYSSNHYDTLKVSKNCTEKEIRNAFLKLSKKHHPDVNKHPKAHVDFLKIQEAYKILSKPESRQLYDLTLNDSHKYIHVYANTYRSGDPCHPANDPFLYVNRDRSKDAENAKKPYYGIKGVKRVSNGLIALICVGFALTGFTIQMTIIRFTFANQHNKILQRSQETQQILNEVREQANKNGNLMQLELLSKRFEDEHTK